MQISLGTSVRKVRRSLGNKIGYCRPEPFLFLDQQLWSGHEFSELGRKVSIFLRPIEGLDGLVSDQGGSCTASWWSPPFQMTHPSKQISAVEAACPLFKKPSPGWIQGAFSLGKGLKGQVFFCLGLKGRVFFCQFLSCSSKSIMIKKGTFSGYFFFSFFCFSKFLYSGRHPSRRKISCK